MILHYNQSIKRGYHLRSRYTFEVGDWVCHVSDKRIMYKIYEINDARRSIRLETPSGVRYTVWQPLAHYVPAEL